MHVYVANHPDAINEFIEEVKQKYCNKLIESGQYALVEQLNEYEEVLFS